MAGIARALALVLALAAGAIVVVALGSFEKALALGFMNLAPGTRG